MELTKFIKSVRYSLFTINCLFLLTGVILLALGIISLVAYSEYEPLITNRFFTLPRLLIITSAIILLVSLPGFYGAISEKFYFIAAYVGLLILILILEIVFTFMGFALRNDGVSEIRPTMVQSLRQYEVRRDVAMVWDELQIEFECCGVVGRNDWILERLPVTCCHIDYGTISPFNCTVDNTYPNGCAEPLAAKLGRSSLAIGITSAIVTTFQILFAAAASWLAYRSKFEEVELES